MITALLGAASGLLGGGGGGGGGAPAGPINANPQFGSVTYGNYTAKPGPNWGLIALIVGLVVAGLFLLLKRK